MPSITPTSNSPTGFWFSSHLPAARAALLKDSQTPSEQPGYLSTARDTVLGYLPQPDRGKRAAVDSWLDGVDSTADPYSKSGRSSWKSRASSFLSACGSAVRSCFTGWTSEKASGRSGDSASFSKNVVPPIVANIDSSPGTATSVVQQSTAGKRTGFFSRLRPETSHHTTPSTNAPRGKTSSFWSCLKPEKRSTASKITSAYSTYASAVETNQKIRNAGDWDMKEWNANETAALKHFASKVSKYTETDRAYHHLMIKYGQKAESDFAKGTATVASELAGDLKRVIEGQGSLCTDVSERTSLAQSILTGALSLNKAVDDCRHRDRRAVEQGMEGMIQSLNVMLV